MLTLFGVSAVFLILAGVIYGVNNDSNMIIVLNLFFLPLILFVTLTAALQVSRHSTVSLEKQYLRKAQALLLEVFDLDLDLVQVKQLGFDKDWSSVRPGVTMGSTLIISDFPDAKSRYHNLVVVKDNETNVRIFATEREALIAELQ